MARRASRRVIAVVLVSWAFSASAVPGIQEFLSGYPSKLTKFAEVRQFANAFMKENKRVYANNGDLSAALSAKLYQKYVEGRPSTDPALFHFFGVYVWDHDYSTASKALYGDYQPAISNAALSGVCGGSDTPGSCDVQIGGGIVSNYGTPLKVRLGMTTVSKEYAIFLRPSQRPIPIMTWNHKLVIGGCIQNPASEGANYNAKVLTCLKEKLLPMGLNRRLVNGILVVNPDELGFGYFKVAGMFVFCGAVAPLPEKSSCIAAPYPIEVSILTFADSDF